MKNIIKSLLAIIIIGLVACTKYDPIYGVADIVEETPIVYAKDMVYIHDNDIYLTDEILATHKRLTNSSSSTKTHCVLASTQDKIAYLDGNGTPVVIDTLGNQIVYLSQYTNVQDINWYNGSNTLYILVNNEVYFYGASLSLPNPLFTAFPSDALTTYVDAIHIDASLNVAYTYRYEKPYSQTSPWRRYYYGVAVNYNSSSTTDRIVDTYQNFYNPSTAVYSNLAYNYYHKVKFCESDNQQKYLVIGFIVNTYQNNGGSYELYRWNYTTNSNAVGTLSTPLFDQTYYDEQAEGNMNTNEFTLRKNLVTLPQGMTTSLINYDFDNANNSYPTYFDWKP